MTVQQINQRRSGALYGLAIGDALGVPREYLTAREIAVRWPSSPLTFEASSRFEGEEWLPGEFSDDTEQALCLLSAGLNKEHLGLTEVQRVAYHLNHWFYTNGKGSGGHTRRVLAHPDFSTDPLKASREVWEAGLPTNPKLKPAANGGVMRTTGVSLLKPFDLNETERLAALYCRVTHFDPRCVASAVAVSIAQACLIQGHSVDDAIAEATQRAFLIEPKIATYMAPVSLASLKLDKMPYSYTYKTVGAAFWALRDCAISGDVLTTVERVIRAGGDADTNAAVAGALIGASGYSEFSWPDHLRRELRCRDRLEKLLTHLHV